ncbi:trehalase isoform X1 [Frankliniella occidentalis]|uniref:Trehalase n=1 Tax=Frankliniella occidentalis TaxID=133901 RepID=A0A6J1TCH4_FRAOC|nr:trehalase isoform X1 [Frankliniella occidentalis]
MPELRAHDAAPAPPSPPPKPQPLMTPPVADVMAGENLPGILESQLEKKLIMDEEAQQRVDAPALLPAEHHEQVLSEAQKAPDMPDQPSVSKEPEFQPIPEDSTITEFEPVIKAPDLPDVPEDAPLELPDTTDFPVSDTPRTLSRYHSRDSLYDDLMPDSVSQAASRRGSLTINPEALAEALENAPSPRPRRLSDGSGAGAPSGMLSRQLSDCSSVFAHMHHQDHEAGTETSPEGLVTRSGTATPKTRKMSVYNASSSAAARSRRASESAAHPRQPRIRRLSVNVASLGNPRIGQRMRRHSVNEMNELCQESLAMLKASKIPVLKFTKQAGRPVSRCCRHPSREEMWPGEASLAALGLPPGAVSVCKCCGSRRFSAAAFGVDGPPIHLSSTTPPTCLVCSAVVCQGDLLRVVQLAGVFPDSKTFVDKKVKQSPEETIRRFQELLQKTGGTPSRDQVVAFVDQSFEDGDELEEWSPPDWTESPSLLGRVADEEFRAWALELNRLWKVLGRRMKEDVRDNPQLYSLLYVPNGFVIPGGRFREIYYWDTYWIVQGMLLCDMRSSVRGVIENLLCLVKRLGFVPNGSRVYYNERSQPPLLVPMVKAYLQHSGDLDFVRENIDVIEREFQFWLNNATVEVTHKGKTYKLARYFSPSDGPRPESYREDVLTANHLSTEEEKQHLYWDLKSAAASGWDFSSRWVIHDGTNGGTLGDLHTRYIVPVDLNSFMYGNAVGLSELYRRLGQEDRAAEYRAVADNFREAVTAVLWHPDLGTWLDYDLLNGTPRRYFYVSNLTPLWTRCYDELQAPEIAKATVRYLFNTGVLKYQGGTPTSLIMTGEQWDFPNCWSPLQGMLVQGLHYTGDPGAQRLALELARRWLAANYKGFQEHKQMFEKYESEVVGRCGGGGEYAPQAGFGWTNGVCFELLDLYGLVASSKDDPELLTYEILVEAEEKALDLNKNGVLSPASDSESDINGFTGDDIGPDSDSETENKVEE